MTTSRSRAGKRLIDEDAEGKSVETMTKALESFKGNLKSEELLTFFQNDVLRLSKVSGRVTTTVVLLVTKVSFRRRPTFRLRSQAAMGERLDRLNLLDDDCSPRVFVRTDQDAC